MRSTPGPGWAGLGRNWGPSPPCRLVWPCSRGPRQTSGDVPKHRPPHPGIPGQRPLAEPSPDPRCFQAATAARAAPGLTSSLIHPDRRRPALHPGWETVQLCLSGALSAACEYVTGPRSPDPVSPILGRMRGPARATSLSPGAGAEPAGGMVLGPCGPSSCACSPGCQVLAQGRASWPFCKK